MRKLSKKATAVIGLFIGIAIYAVIFIYIYEGNIEKFLEIATRGKPESVVLAYIARVGVLVFHALTWWAVLRAFGKVNLLKVAEIIFAAIFVEFIVPIGGATEVARFFLAVKLGLTDREGAIASIFAHRLVASVSILVTTVVALVSVGAPLSLIISLGLPALGLVGGNAALFVLPKFRRVEIYTSKLFARFGMTVDGLSKNYEFRLNQLKKATPLLALAFLFAFLERFTNGFYGMEIAGIAGIDLSFVKSLLAFDSLYTIIWLLPALTPGGIGVFEFIQTGLLTYLGIGMDEAAAMSIISRAYYVVGEYPLFAASVIALGYNVKEFLKQALGNMKNNKS